MGTSQRDKAETHRRIVDLAARRLRERGIDGIGVADLMKEAGLTVGGFYKHFPARDHLVAEAVASTFGRFQEREGEGFAALVDVYLAPEHRDTPGAGCPFAALGPDLARCPDMTRGPAGAEIARNIDLLAASLGGDRDQAIHAYAALVGAISLARVVPDAALSDEILAATARRLKAEATDAGD